ncbi:unnamed protein product, partial [marine sediment metagenome]
QRDKKQKKEKQKDVFGLLNWVQRAYRFIFMCFTGEGIYRKGF